MSASRASASAAELYARLVATRPDVELKGASIPYTSMNGNMFSMLSKQGFVALRLSERDLSSFLAKYDTTLHEEHGVVRKDYAVVPHALLERTKELAPWFAKSADHARTLRAKPTTRSKKPAATAGKPAHSQRRARASNPRSESKTRTQPTASRKRAGPK